MRLGLEKGLSRDYPVARKCHRARSPSLRGSVADEAPAHYLSRSIDLFGDNCYYNTRTLGNIAMSDLTTEKEIRLNVRVKGLLADHIERLIGSHGVYENQSEYLRDLIRQDMYQHDDDSLRREIQASYSQLSKGNFREIAPEALFDEAMKELENEGHIIKD